MLTHSVVERGIDSAAVLSVPPPHRGVLVPEFPKFSLPTPLIDGCCITQLTRLQRPFIKCRRCTLSSRQENRRGFLWSHIRGTEFTQQSTSRNQICIPPTFPLPPFSPCQGIGVDIGCRNQERVMLLSYGTSIGHTKYWLGVV